MCEVPRPLTLVIDIPFVTENPLPSMSPSLNVSGTVLYATRTLEASLVVRENDVVVLLGAT